MIPPKPESQHQSEMFRISLTDACRWDHPLVQLAGKISWELFEDDFDALYCEDNGRPGLPIRMMAGLLLLKYTRGVSDEEMVEWWLDSPYVQYFCGEKYFQQYAPLDASSLCRFRDRIGESGCELILKSTVIAGLAVGALKESDLKDYDRLKKYLKNDLNVEALPSWGVGKLLFEVFEKTVEHKLLQPTFITQYPVEVSPLSRVNDNNSFVTDRFEFFVAGMEIANGFSELNDPEDQAARFRKQMENRESGDVEAMHFDSDYIRALEYGLPPSAGEGIGIDRLVMLLTNNPSIRDVILFPYLKPMNR